MKIAVCSSDGKNVNLHFGKGYSLYIYEYDEELDKINFIEHRAVEVVENKKEQSGLIIEAIKDDCDVAICAEYGFKASINAKEFGLKLVRDEGTVKEALEKYIHHVNFMKNIKI